MKKMLRYLSYGYLFCFSQFLHIHADVFQNSAYDICFTPGGECATLIVNTIKESKSSIHVQAYSFTNVLIADALVQAKERGVDVKIILDKSQFSDKYSSAKFFLNHNIPMWKDHRVAIAHNKVMIIDNQTVITGSFNFTKAAQEKNAENVLIVTDKELASKYIANWSTRMAFSDFVTNSN